MNRATTEQCMPSHEYVVVFIDMKQSPVVRYGTVVIDLHAIARHQRERPEEVSQGTVLKAALNSMTIGTKGTDRDIA
jgi:hypothetical protein